MHSACQAFASGRSGRAVRLEPGDIAGNDALSFDYKDGVVQFSSWQDNSWWGLDIRSGTKSPVARERYLLTLVAS